MAAEPCQARTDVQINLMTTEEAVATASRKEGAARRMRLRRSSTVILPSLMRTHLGILRARPAALAMRVKAAAMRAMVTRRLWMTMAMLTMVTRRLLACPLIIFAA